MKGDLQMSKSKSLPKRNEVEKQFTWAIEDLYATDELWEKEYNKLKELLPKAESYRGTLSESAKALLEFLKLSDELGIMMERVYVYANQNIMKIPAILYIRILQIRQGCYWYRWIQPCPLQHLRF